jgi:integrase
MTSALDDYLAVRRSFGHALDTTGRVLRRFAAFADAEGAEHITAALFLRWKAHFGSASDATWAARLGMVHGFATWLYAHDPGTEIPPLGLVPAKARRSRPYIYSEAEVAAILAEAARLPSPYGLRGWTCATLFGLIAATGLRVSEAVGIDDRHVDLGRALLSVERGKNGRARLLPLADSTTARLQAYRRERDRLLGPGSGPFFRYEDGRRPTDCNARYQFAQISQRIGLREAQRFSRHGRGPRIHDLRHTFAVRTILDWYRRGLDADREIPKLSAYLGHVKPEHTYWYIEAVPELMQLAAWRAERKLTQEAAQ